MKSRKDKDMVAMFKEVYKELNAKGHHTALHILNNECSKAVKQYISSEKLTSNLLSLTAIASNQAKQAVKSAKYHTLASLITLDPNCLIRLWLQHN